MINTPLKPSGSVHLITYLNPLIPKTLWQPFIKWKYRNNHLQKNSSICWWTGYNIKRGGFTKIAVPTSEGFELIPSGEVIRCEADDNYTHLFLKNKKKITACRTLKEMEEQMESFSSFLRVHNSWLVNLNEVTKYVRGEGGYLIMSDGSSVNVSRSRKESLLRKLVHSQE